MQETEEARKPRPDMIEEIKKLTNRKLIVIFLNLNFLIGTSEGIIKTNKT
jgi:hypothetical protein